MRMALPPLRVRRQIVRHLRAFFREHRKRDFNAAIKLFCDFYRLRKPRVEWFEYIDHGRTWGATYQHGLMHLIHPENWQGTEAQWTATVAHELGHFLLWSDCERKADLFAERMEAGL